MSAEEQSDNFLAARAQLGDKMAFTRLVHIYGPRLAALVRSTGIPRDAVEDITQEAFIAAWRSIQDYDKTRPVKSWLFQIALNKARDWRRRRRVRAFFFGALPFEETAELVPSMEAGPEQTAEDRGLLRRVGQLVASLPLSLQAPFVLTTVGGLTHPEAAEVLGLSAKAIERRLVRARERLESGLRALKS